MKKIIAFILCSVIAVSLFAGCSGKDKPGEESGEKYKPEDIVTQDGFSYVIGEDGNATIVKYEVHDMQEKLEIPDKLGGAPVTVIGKEAFAGNKKISEVKFPAMLETIEDGAFKESDIHIALMVYSSRLKTIGADAFSFCTNLVQIDVPKSVESYGERCFGNAQDAEMSFTIPWDKLEEVVDGLELTHRNGVRYPYPAHFNYTPTFPENYRKLEELWEQGAENGQ